ncbi:MAG TPA: SCO family protein [Gaiellaceae bacterium]|nr:SCO family protein [Gaiellaceae bacterium]
MRSARLPLVALLLLLALAVSACGSKSESTPTTTVGGGSGAFAGGELTPARSTPDFTLTDQSGDSVSMAAQRGKLVLLTFLYTHCPDVCPLITQNLNQALRTLGPERDDVRVLAVSVDPEGDTPKSVDEFAQAHHLLPQFHYLVGSRTELTKIWKDYGVAAVASDPELVDHTAYTMLVDRSGEGRVIYDSQVQAKDVVHDVRLMLSS